jgi:hypothetical protein
VNRRLLIPSPRRACHTRGTGAACRAGRSRGRDRGRHRPARSRPVARRTPAGGFGFEPRGPLSVVQQSDLRPPSPPARRHVYHGAVTADDLTPAQIEQVKAVVGTAAPLPNPPDTAYGPGRMVADRPGVPGGVRGPPRRSRAQRATALSEPAAGRGRQGAAVAAEGCRGQTLTHENPSDSATAGRALGAGAGGCASCRWRS